MFFDHLKLRSRNNIKSWKYQICIQITVPQTLYWIILMKIHKKIFLNQIKKNLSINKKI